MKRFNWQVFILPLALLSTLACTLLGGGGGGITIDPPRGNITPLAGTNAPPQATVDITGLPINPPSDVIERINPEIINLINNVSQQQLTGYVQTLESFGTRHSLSETASGVNGIGAARRWIHDEFVRVGGGENGRLNVSYHDFSFAFNGVQSQQRNVVAKLPGTGNYPGIILFTAHYDSRNGDLADGGGKAPGATDNASGTSALIELARLMSAREWSQTIMFVALAAEEQGTHGSKNFARKSVFDGDQIEAVVNLDVVGGAQGIPQSVRVFADPNSPTDPINLAKQLEAISQKYQPDFPITIINSLDRDNRFGDQREFLNAGIPAVRMTQSTEEQAIHHTDRDTSNRLDFAYLMKVVKLNLALAADWSDAPIPSGPPVIVPVTEPNNTGAFRLSWVPTQGASGYAISFRLPNDPSRELRYLTDAHSTGVILTGFVPGTTYNVSMATVSAGGTLSPFSLEIPVTTRE